jgi:transposase
MLPQDNPIYNEIALSLNILEPFYISNIEFDRDKYIVNIYVEYHPKITLTCPECGAEHVKIHSKNPRTWHGLDILQFQTLIHMNAPRIKCPTCGIIVYPLPWTTPRSCMTIHKQHRILAMSTSMPITNVEKHTGETPSRIGTVIANTVERARCDLNMHDVTKIGVDETSTKKGHEYITVVVNLENQQLLFATPGKGADALEAFRDELILHCGSPDNITDIAMDMSPAYISGAEKYFPNARIIFDKFHLVKHANCAVDQVRREEVSKIPQLKGSRYLWLRNQTDLTDKQRNDILNLSKFALNTGRAYRYKLALQEFYKCTTEEDAIDALNRMYSWGIRSRLEPLKELARTIKRHFNGIINHFVNGLTSGLVESINGRIQNIKRRSRGFPNDQNFINMLYLCLGKLPIYKLYSTGEPVLDSV